MSTRNILMFACCALALVVCAEPDAATGEAPPLYRVKENGYALLTKDTMKQIIASEVAVRKKLAEPRYFTDVQNDLPDLLRALTSDPFDGRPVGIDKTMPDAVQKDVWGVWQAYEAYMLRVKMRKELADLLSTYNSRGLFRYTARVDRAKRFYKSDRMKKLLHDLKMFNYSFKRLCTSVMKEYEGGATFGQRFPDRVSLDTLFNVASEFGAYMSEKGQPKSSFWNSLEVLMRYNARMCDDELKKMKEASKELSKWATQFMDIRQNAVNAATFYKESVGDIKEIMELDERIVDCLTLALCELDATIKVFEDTGTPEYELRSGLPLAWVISTQDAGNRREGPDYKKIVWEAYSYLQNRYDKISEKKYGRPIPVK